MSDELVYSTGDTSGAKGKGKGKGKRSKSGKHGPGNQAKASSAYVRSEGPTRMRLESKGRGGKKVTVLFDLPFAEEEARELMQELQQSLGVGATLKNSTIELRGDIRAKVEKHFQNHDLKIIRAGG